MPAIQVRIHDKVFPTKASARNAIRSILYRYRPGEVLNNADAHFMLGVLTLHPHAAQKIGCGVKSFSVEQYEWTCGFSLTRIDGTTTDWSYIVCLDPPTPAKEATKGFRTEIREQIKDFRCAFFRASIAPRCPITQIPLTNDLNTHVDHDPPFKDLLQTFLSTRSLTLEDVRTDATQDNDCETHLSDQELAADWRAYHQRHATLRVVSKRANLMRRGR